MINNKGFPRKMKERKDKKHEKSYILRKRKNNSHHQLLNQSTTCKGRDMVKEEISLIIKFSQCSFFKLKNPTRKRSYILKNG